MAFLKVTQVSVKGETNVVLKDISFLQQQFQKIAIAGETGSGKSTLLKVIAGLAQPFSGEVWFEQKRVSGPLDQLVPGCPGIAYLSQQFELPKFLRVEQILAYANELADDDANALFDVCQINHLLKRRTDQLSGGEQQRIALAKLLITSPRLLLLDEPFSNLDMVHKNTLKKVISDISNRLKITCILVSHDPLDTLPWADKIIVMKDGQVIQQGSSEKIYTKPVNEYIAGLFGNYNLLSPAQHQCFTSGDIALKRRDAIVRPERFKLMKKGKSASKGKVINVRYYGSYFEADVLHADKIILVRSENRIKKNDVVYLALTDLFI